jgi:hypothetical protein
LPGWTDTIYRQEELNMKQVSRYRPLLVTLHWMFAILIITVLALGFFEIAGTRLRIGPIEAIDGTPVVDIKAVIVDGTAA